MLIYCIILLVLVVGGCTAKGKNEFFENYLCPKNTATVNGRTFKVALAEGKAAAAPAAAPAASGAGSDLLAPLPGTVTKIVAAAGSRVNAGDTVLVIEAMKMETEIKADNAGVVKELCVAQGAVVAAGDKLAVIG